MRTLISSIGTLLAFGVFGQITITSADMPVVNDVLLRATSMVTTFDPNDTGANHSWDYSMLTPNDQGGDTAVAVTATPFLYQFFFNNGFIYPDHEADYALRGEDFGAQGLTVSDVYEYFKVESNGFRNVGFGANINGLPSSVQRIPVDEIYALPMNFGDNSTSYSTFEISVPLLLFLREEQNRTNQVDGWGTLMLPDGQSYNTLRVASTIDRVDSIYLDAAGFGFSLPLPQTVEYKWLAAGEPEPLLTITVVGGLPTNVTYKIDAFTSIKEQGESLLEVFPNPSTGIVQIRSTQADIQTYQVLDLSGKLLDVRVERGNFIWDLSDLAPGEYFILSNGNTSRIQILKN